MRRRGEADPARALRHEAEVTVDRRDQDIEGERARTEPNADERAVVEGRDHELRRALTAEETRELRRAPRRQVERARVDREPLENASRRCRNFATPPERSIGNFTSGSATPSSATVIGPSRNGASSSIVKSPLTAPAVAPVDHLAAAAPAPRRRAQPEAPAPRARSPVAQPASNDRINHRPERRICTRTLQSSPLRRALSVAAKPLSRTPRDPSAERVWGWGPKHHFMDRRRRPWPSSCR